MSNNFLPTIICRRLLTFTGFISATSKISLIINEFHQILFLPFKRNILKSVGTFDLTDLTKIFLDGPWLFLSEDFIEFCK